MTVNTDENTVNVPGGSTVTTGDGPSITVGEGGATVGTDGGVTLPDGGSATIGSGDDTTTITTPGGGTLQPNDDGSITVPGGSTVQTGDGPEMTLPGGGTVDPGTGAVTPDEGGSVVIGSGDDTTTITPPSGQPVTPNDDGSVTIPGGSTVTGSDGGARHHPARGRYPPARRGRGVHRDRHLRQPGRQPGAQPGHHGGRACLPAGRPHPHRLPFPGLVYGGHRRGALGLYPAGDGGPDPLCPVGLPSPANPNYKITIGDTENGTVTVNPTAAKEGTTVTITPVPDAGYQVGTVSVTDRFGQAVAVDQQADGTYTFVMPDGQVTVEVTFLQGEATDLPFSDVTESDWFYDAVTYAYENGLMDGGGDGPVRPQQ